MADIFQPKGEKQGNAKKRSFDELALAFLLLIILSVDVLGKIN